MEYENTNHDYTDTGVHLWDITDEEIYTDSELVHLSMTFEEAESLLSTPNNDTTVADVLSGCAAAIN
tara:strand:+ start:954 stop:1154 length:201 start_codon:yes stop_codon:yes gene_type:complete